MSYEKMDETAQSSRLARKREVSAELALRRRRRG